MLHHCPGGRHGRIRALSEVARRRRRPGPDVVAVARALAATPAAYPRQLRHLDLTRPGDP